MTSNVRFHPDAETELTDAAVYYEHKREGLGEEFLDAVAGAVEFALGFPKASPVARGPYRSLVISKFPYSIIYRPLEDGSLRVLAVAHHKRRPEYWRDR